MCAGTADLPTRIVCSLQWLPGGMWQMVTLQFASSPSCSLPSSLPEFDEMSDDLATFDESEWSSSLHSLSSSSLSSLSLFLDVSWRPSAFDIAEASDRDASALLGAPPQADSSAAEKHTTPIAIHRNCIGKTPVGRIR